MFTYLKTQRPVLLPRWNLSLISLFFSGLFLTPPSWASDQLYKQIDEQGNVTYSDQPIGERLELPPLSTLPAVSEPEKKPPSAPPTSLPGYTAITFVSPTQDQVLWTQGRIEVSILVQPRLQKNHSVQLLLDGRVAVKASPQLAFSLTNIDRGSHRLQAQVLDSNGNILASSPIIEVHVKRHSKLFNR